MPITIDPNTQLNFERRVLYPNRYPQIQNSDGSYSTHKMAWTSIGDKFIAFPMIVQTKDGSLMEFTDPSKAIIYALENKEFREFLNAEEAESYATNGYKKFWGTGK